MPFEHSLPYLSTIIRSSNLISILSNPILENTVGHSFTSPKDNFVVSRASLVHLVSGLLMHLVSSEQVNSHRLLITAFFYWNYVLGMKVVQTIPMANLGGLIFENWLKGFHLYFIADVIVILNYNYS